MYLAAPEYYDLLELPRNRLFALLAELIGASGTDLETVFAARRGDEILGAYAAAEGDDLHAAAAGSARYFMRGLDREQQPRFIKAARQQQLPDIPAGTLHLVRIAVFPEFRGQRLAHALMRHFINRGSGRPLSIYVRSDNTPAIAVYTRLGFEQRSGSSTR